MNIAIIGTGNVGGALASNFAYKGHSIYLGVRDSNNFKGKQLLDNPNTTAQSIAEAADIAEVIIVATAPEHTESIVNAIGNTKGKVIIDAMNLIMTKPDRYNNSFDAFKAFAPEAEIVKCFNTTGFENMKDPIYDGKGIDMFVAGSSSKGKEIATQLALDAGFEKCYDFGGDDKVELLEKFALSWINIAIMQGEGRNMAFKILKDKHESSTNHRRA